MPFSRGSSQRKDLGLLRCRCILYRLSHQGSPSSWYLLAGFLAIYLIYTHTHTHTHPYTSTNTQTATVLLSQEEEEVYKLSSFLS